MFSIRLPNPGDVLLPQFGNPSPLGEANFRLFQRDPGVLLRRQRLYHSLMGSGLRKALRNQNKVGHVFIRKIVPQFEIRKGWRVITYQYKDSWTFMISSCEIVHSLVDIENELKPGAKGRMRIQRFH